MKTFEIEMKLTQLIREERRITNEILELINIALERRSYLELGFASMFGWLVRGYGFSNAAAYRRIEAARMLKAVPEVAEKLSDGRVNLTSLSKAQSIVKQHEKLSGEKVSLSEKALIIESIVNKSVVEAKQALVAKFPETASTVYQERHRIINADQIRYQLNLPNIAKHNISRAKEVLSHKFPNATDADIITYALEFLIERIDPLASPVTSAAEVTLGVCAIKNKKSQKSTRLEVIRQAEGKCSFKDPRTGRTCGSSYQLEIDHIRPKALGGSDDPSNLRVLCRQHNLLAAERSFGKSHMHQYRRQ